MQRVTSWLRPAPASNEPFDGAIDEPLIAPKGNFPSAVDAFTTAAGSASVATAQDIVVTLTRNETGLGLVFDLHNRVTNLLPGCAAALEGTIMIGDQLVAVDGVQVSPGDHIAALFPMKAASFEVRVRRRRDSCFASEDTYAPDYRRHGAHHPRSGRESPGGSSPHDRPSPRSPQQEREQRSRQGKAAGKFDGKRSAPVFQEVVWNEYCILFPDGSTAPFEEAVRYTALTGYLRKKAVMRDGRAEFALAHGESQRGWSRHFFHLSMKQLAWFDEDPQAAMQRQRTASTRGSMKLRMAHTASAYKLEHSAGKGVGSALLYTAPCRLFVSRLHRNEFALSFGDGQLVIMQAASGADAHAWIGSIASCLFFSSATFEGVLVHCQRFFDAAHKTVEGKLSPIEALDLVRAMGHEITYSQCVDALKASSPEGGWFGPREFTYLVRTVCQEADPRAELLRAFRMLDTKASSSASGDAEREPHISVSDLVAMMRTAGVSEEHILTVLRACGVEAGDTLVPYARLADALFPTSATAEKRRRVLLPPAQVQKEGALEGAARQEWEGQRDEILLAALTASPGGRPPPVLQSAVGGGLHGACTPVEGGVVGPQWGVTAAAQATRIQMPLLPLNLKPATGAANDLTPRRREIQMSMATAMSVPATPRTIADRVNRARRATAAAAAKLSGNRLAPISARSTETEEMVPLQPTS